MTLLPRGLPPRQEGGGQPVDQPREDGRGGLDNGLHHASEGGQHVLEHGEDIAPCHAEDVHQETFKDLEHLGDCFPGNRQGLLEGLEDRLHGLYYRVPHRRKGRLYPLRAAWKACFDDFPGCCDGGPEAFAVVPQQNDGRRRGCHGRDHQADRPCQDRHHGGQSGGRRRSRGGRSGEDCNGRRYRADDRGHRTDGRYDGQYCSDGHLLAARQAIKPVQECGGQLCRHGYHGAILVASSAMASCMAAEASGSPELLHYSHRTIPPRRRMSPPGCP